MMVTLQRCIPEEPVASWQGVEGNGSILKEKGEKLSPSHQCQSKTLDGIVLWIPNFMAELSWVGKMWTYFFYRGTFIFSQQRELFWVSCLRQSLKNTVPCLSEMFWGATARFQMRATIMLWRLSEGRMLLSLSLLSLLELAWKWIILNHLSVWLSHLSGSCRHILCLMFS